MYSKSVETIFGNEHHLVGLVFFFFLFFGLVVRYWLYLIGQNISLNWNYDSYFITSTLFDTIFKKKKTYFCFFFDQKNWKILKKTCFSSEILTNWWLRVIRAAIFELNHLILIIAKKFLKKKTIWENINSEPIRVHTNKKT